MAMLLPRDDDAAAEPFGAMPVAVAAYVLIEQNNPD
jgi:predicted permease